MLEGCGNGQRYIYTAATTACVGSVLTASPTAAKLCARSYRELCISGICKDMVFDVSPCVDDQQMVGLLRNIVHM